ncbi:4-hydroxyphenylacetate 3-monooxygenase, reductase component [Volucribacter amazonae]|uniref:4-hydroxyphenylacetate 3-monooxygenase reductase component n=1 Tax=Volucribacter amazonae TaxID=256731 RepID=A0A9X4PAX9_9PAST|nr:4-hydroxyphenylacetate 3-monooxygenase, reductase component [Volucribacter amazonae]MDG6894211.1 4-hydroxyphenylacetate 3-monooxygenase [Volucribacter amazonae]
MLDQHQQRFREAMAHLTSAVSIVTTSGKAGKVGLTISSVCSVTDSPPTLLMCINQQSDTHDILHINKQVCINILNSQQQDLALHFANMADSTMEQRLAWDCWQDNLQGIPVLKQAVANLNGKIIGQNIVGSHSVFFVELDHIEVNSQDALGYFNRQFKCIHK